MSATSYIEKLPLADATYGKASIFDLGLTKGATRSTRPLAPEEATQTFAIPQDPKAVVNAASLLSFVDGVSAQDKDDILYSVQLAHRGASGNFDRFTQTESWYQKYVEVLETIGWAMEHLAFTKHDQSEGELRMDKAALSLIAAVATQNQLAILKQALDTLASLAEEDDKLRLFDFHAAAEMSGNFQLGAVQQAPNGALTMALGAFHFRSIDHRRRFLFFSWGAQQLNFWTAAQKLTFNAALYAGHREAVQRKLGDSAAEFIADLHLG